MARAENLDKALMEQMMKNYPYTPEQNIPKDQSSTEIFNSKKIKDC